MNMMKALREEYARNSNWRSWASREKWMDPTNTRRISERPPLTQPAQIILADHTTVPSVSPPPYPKSPLPPPQPFIPSMPQQQSESTTLPPPDPHLQLPKHGPP